MELLPQVRESLTPEQHELQFRRLKYWYSQNPWHAERAAREPAGEDHYYRRLHLSGPMAGFRPIPSEFTPTE